MLAVIMEYDSKKEHAIRNSLITAAYETWIQNWCDCLRCIIWGFQYNPHLVSRKIMPFLFDRDIAYHNLMNIALCIICVFVGDDAIAAAREAATEICRMVMLNM